MGFVNNDIFSGNKKEMECWCVLQSGWTFNDYAKEGARRNHILYEYCMSQLEWMSRKGNYIERKGKLVNACLGVGTVSNFANEHKEPCGSNGSVLTNYSNDPWKYSLSNGSVWKWACHSGIQPFRPNKIIVHLKQMNFIICKLYHSKIIKCYFNCLFA